MVLWATGFGPYVDERALLDLARSTRPVPHGPSGDEILLYLSAHVSHSPTGHRVFLTARSTPLPEAARLVEANGRIVATARFEAPASHGCLFAAAVAEFPVAHDVVEAFSGLSVVGHRAEALVRAGWRPVRIVMSNCFSVE